MTLNSDATAATDEIPRTKDLMFLERARDWFGVPTAAWGLGLVAVRLGLMPEHFLSPGRLAWGLTFVGLAGLVFITPVLFAAVRTRRDHSRSGFLTVAIVFGAIVLGFLPAGWPELHRW